MRDGPGILANPKHNANKLYEAIRDAVAGACGYCAGAFHAEESVREADVHLLHEYEGHPSIRSLVNDGYQVITF